jgi:peptidoglycan/xylan/chitin deacetylase (PgdA/CDA1 family)
VIQILFEAKSSSLETQVVVTIDDVFLRNEWTDGIETVSSNKIKPEEDFQVLDILELMNTDATLFVCGIVAELFPERLKELARRKFEIAAHGYRHENFLMLSEAEQKRRMELAKRLLEGCIDKKVLGWRSPGLQTSAALYRMMENAGIRWCSNVEVPLFFNNVPFQYYGMVELPISIIDLKLYESNISPAKVLQKLLANLNRHHIILNLVIHPWSQLRKPERLQALRHFLEEAHAMEGVSFRNGSYIYQQFVSGGPSIYGSLLSTALGLWKRISPRIRGSVSEAHRTVLKYA